MTTWFGLRFSTVPWAVTSMGTCAPSAGPVMLIEGAGCAGLADAVLGAVALAAKYDATLAVPDHPYLPECVPPAEDRTGVLIARMSAGQPDRCNFQLAPAPPRS
jgi:hypothetical protein